MRGLSIRWRCACNKEFGAREELAEHVKQQQQQNQPQSQNQHPHQPEKQQQDVQPSSSPSTSPSTSTSTSPSTSTSTPASTPSPTPTPTPAPLCADTNLIAISVRGNTESELRELVELIAGILNGFQSYTIRAEMTSMKQGAEADSAFDKHRNGLLVGIEAGIVGAHIKCASNAGQPAHGAVDAVVVYEDVPPRSVLLTVHPLPFKSGVLAVLNSDRGKLFPSQRCGANTKPVQVELWLRSLKELQWEQLLLSSPRDIQQHEPFAPFQFRNASNEEALGAAAPESDSDEYKMATPCILDADSARKRVRTFLTTALLNQRHGKLSIGVDDKSRVRLGVQYEERDFNDLYHRLNQTFRERRFPVAIFPPLPHHSLRVTFIDYPNTEPSDWKEGIPIGKKIFESSEKVDEKMLRKVQEVMAERSKVSPVFVKRLDEDDNDGDDDGRAFRRIAIYSPLTDADAAAPGEWELVSDADELSEVRPDPAPRVSRLRSIMEISFEWPTALVFSRYRIQPQTSAKYHAYFPLLGSVPSPVSIASTQPGNKPPLCGPTNPLAAWLRARSFPFIPKFRSRLVGVTNTHILVAAAAEEENISLPTMREWLSSGAFTFHARLDPALASDTNASDRKDRIATLPQSTFYYWYMRVHTLPALARLVDGVREEFPSSVHQVILLIDPHSDMMRDQLYEEVSAAISQYLPEDVEVVEAIPLALPPQIPSPSASTIASSTSSQQHGASLSSSTSAPPPPQLPPPPELVSRISDDDIDVQVVRKTFYTWLSSASDSRQSVTTTGPPWEYVRHKFIAETTPAVALYDDLAEKLCIGKELTPAAVQRIVVCKISQGCGATGAVMVASFKAHTHNVLVLWLRGDRGTADRREELLATFDTELKRTGRTRLLILADDHVREETCRMVHSVLNQLVNMRNERKLTPLMTASSSSSSTSPLSSPSSPPPLIRAALVNVRLIGCTQEALKASQREGHHIIDPLLRDQDVDAVVQALKLSAQQDNQQQYAHICAQLDAARQAAIKLGAPIWNRHLFVFCLTATSGQYAPPKEWVLELYGKLIHTQAQSANGSDIPVSAQVKNLALLICFPSAFGISRQHIDQRVNPNLNTDGLESLRKAVASHAFGQLFASRGNLGFHCVHPLIARLFIMIALKFDWSLGLDMHKIKAGWSAAMHVLTSHFTPDAVDKYLTTMLIDRVSHRKYEFARLIQACLDAPLPPSSSASASASAAISSSISLPTHRYQLVQELISAIPSVPKKTIAHLDMVQCRSALALQKQLHQIKEEWNQQSQNRRPADHLYRANKEAQEKFFQLAIDHADSAVETENSLSTCYQLALATYKAYRWDPQQSKEQKEERRQKAFSMMSFQYQMRSDTDAYKSTVAKYLADLREKENRAGAEEWKRTAEELRLKQKQEPEPELASNLDILWWVSKVGVNQVPGTLSLVHGL